MSAAKWLRPIVRSVDADTLERAARRWPIGRRYVLIAWGPLVVIVEGRRR
jgi:hypothetical protein